MQGSRDLSAAASLTEYRIDRGSLSSGTWNKYLCISITIFCSTNGTEEPKSSRSILQREPFVELFNFELNHVSFIDYFLDDISVK